MAISTITATDGTVRATTLIGLLYQLVLLGHNLQGRYNRAKPKFKKNAIAIDYKFDGEISSLVAKISLEGQRVLNPVTNKPEFQLDDTFGEYITDAAGAPAPWEPGTGFLVDCPTYEEALLHTAKMVSFYESQIEPDQLLKEINIVNETPTPEDGNDTLDISLPLRNGWNETIGQSFITPKNYLYILDVSDTEVI